MAKRPVKIHIHTAMDGGYYFTCCSGNGQVRTTSETYVLLSGCKRAVKSHIAEMKGEVKLKDHTI